jgi:hypothetical protein
MHGVQLWVGLPDSARHGPPGFDHHPSVPVLRDGGATVTVVVGEVGGERSPVRAYTPLVGAEVLLSAGGRLRLPLEPDFEYGLLAMNGTAEVDGGALPPGSLLYLDRGRSGLDLRADDGAGDVRVFLLGGTPFDEPLVMWWNFVARSHDEIVAAREDWAAGRRFGTVHGYAGDRLPAPEMPTTRLRARDRLGRTSPA